METKDVVNNVNDYKRNMPKEKKYCEEEWTSHVEKSSSPSISIKEQYKKFVSETSFTAIAKIHNSNSCMKKFVWLILVLSMFGWLTVQCLWLFQTYFSYPVEVRFEMVSVSKLEFPSVTICNRNPLKYSQVNKSDSPFLLLSPVLEVAPNDLLYNKALEMLQKSYKGQTTTSIDWTQVMIDSEFNMWQALTDEETARLYYSSLAQHYDASMLYATIGTILRPHEVEKYGHKKNDLIMSCSFEGLQCSPQNFTYMYSKTYGNCYIFNSFKHQNPPVETYYSGASNGLHLELNIEQSEYINSLAPDSGVVISVHERGLQPFPEDDGVFVAPGSSAFIGLKKTLINRLPPPHASCSHTPNRKDWYMERYGVLYHKKTCIKSCIQSLMIKECHCGVPYYFLPKDTDICNITDKVVVDCISHLQRFFEECKSQCPDSCREIKYEKIISTSRWPSMKYKDFLEERSKKTNWDFMGAEHDYSNDELLKVHIYFEDLAYDEIEQQKAYEFQNLISDVGGQLGLWLGLSAITIGELMELFAAVFKTLTKKLINRRNKVDKIKPLKTFKYSKDRDN